MTYTETVDWLFAQLPNYQLQGGEAYKPGLENICKLLTLTGDPHKGLRFFHVAGTNGKGSVSNMLASILQTHGYKTGLFTSPHLHDFRERIRINGEMVSEEFVVNYVASYKDSWKEINPSFFEITTAMALAAFNEANCHISVIETGLGGRLDSTNIIQPEISIITNIGLDHTTFLGNTVEEIAFEKAGIIKQNTPVVIGEWNTKTLPVFEEIARQKNAPLHLAKQPPRFETDLGGSFQRINLSTVLSTIDILNQNGWSFTDENIRQGLLSVQKNTGFKGRFQQISQKPTILVDAAHNADGVRLLFNEIAQLSFEKLHLIYGAANDKDVLQILKLFPENARCHFVQFKSKRSFTVSELKQISVDANLPAAIHDSSIAALESAKKDAGENDLIVVFGSFYLIQEIL